MVVNLTIHAALIAIGALPGSLCWILVRAILNQSAHAGTPAQVVWFDLVAFADDVVKDIAQSKEVHYRVEADNFLAVLVKEQNRRGIEYFQFFGPLSGRGLFAIRCDDRLL